MVDDNSPDGTGDIADALAERWPGRMSVIHRAGKLGLGSAYLAGFLQALRESYDYVVQMDADFSHDPDDVPRLVAATGTADVVIGSRYTAGGRTEDWPLSRWLISRGGSWYTQLLLQLPIVDPTSGFKCFRRSALARLDLTSVRAKGFGFQVEVNWLCHRSGLRLVETPIRFADRKRGQSKMSLRIFLEALSLVWRLRREGSVGRQVSGGGLKDGYLASGASLSRKTPVS